MIGQTISHYRIVSKLGEGGMGVVYLAEDTILQRRVAIKTLTDGGVGRQHFRMRFLREARAVSALSHANIATIHDYGETANGQPYIVMEFVKGRTLADLLNENRLPLARAVEIIIDVAKALGEAHRHGIVHRDIKPSNIAINERDQVKVLDFGLAKQIDSFLPATDHSESPLLPNTQTREGIIVGTPMYLSPEQALGMPVDERSDLFSLGSVLYECITGQPAFAAASAVEICAKVIRDEPLPPSQLNSLIQSDLDRITLKALTKRPDERYRTAEECLRDLSAVNEVLRHDAARSPKPAVPTLPVTNPLHAPATRGISTISAIFTRPKLSIGCVGLAVSLIALAAFGLYFGLRPRPYQASAAAQKSYEIGTNNLREGSYSKAIKSLEQAVSLDNKFALAHARLAEAYVELDYHDKANQAVLKASALANLRSSMLSPQDSLYLQGINATVLHDFGKAIEYYTMILRQASPENRNSALLDLGRAFERNEDFENAAKSYLEITSRAREYATTLLRLGVLNGRQQNIEKAQEYFNQSEKLFKEQGNDEGITEVYFQRGSLLNDLSRTAEAKADSCSRA